MGLALLLTMMLTPRAAVAQLAHPVVEQRLSNGLRALMSPDPTSAEVSIVVCYDVGSRDEPAGLEGLAHFVEHLMFLATKHVPKGTLMRVLEQAGATRINGTTTRDDTCYFETLPPERLELGLWVESDRMGYGLDTLDQATLESARREVLNEERERTGDKGLGGLGGWITEALFPRWHPYRHVLAGDVSSLQWRLSIDDARAFKRTWYGPSNAVMAIVGKFESGTARALVQRYFGALPARPPPKRPVLPQITWRPAAVMHAKAPITRKSVHLSWLTPRRGEPDDTALDLAAALLVNNGAGWLEAALLQQPRYASHVSASQKSMLYASIFDIDVTVAEGRTPKEVIERVEQALRRFERDVTKEALDRAKKRMLVDGWSRLDSTLGLAWSLTLWARRGQVRSPFDDMIGRYGAVQPGAVRDAARRWISTKPSATVIVSGDDRFPLAGLIVKREGLWW